MGECEEDGGRGAAEEEGGGAEARGVGMKKKVSINAFRDVSSCKTYNYSDALYWDSRYISEAGSFDWYQRYPDLRPFVRRYIPTSSTVLMVGCGNAVMSEDMVKDGYEDIMNIDISPVAIDMMRKKYENIPHLKYMQMDVRDMSFFPDESFDSVIDKGTLDSLMCGTTAPISVSQMLGEVSRFRLHHLRSCF
eukprot:TRINITY_DN4604_c0_g2_i17.p1 TRINITY_DN4604_c0_g2~~TRINITY_DN4604_c0_g2_i17.p1  ORF type:complete len:192 (-),score=28.89 TRINITY_DN4604_c0_g2_i17:235-810(-)